jgi:glutamate dehydrogenase
MITADPQRRAAALDEIQHILASEGPPDDRELLQEFAPVVFAAMPDTLALRLPAPELARRIRQYLNFVAHTVTPAFQLYKGLPGLHVAVHNPSDDEEPIGRPVDGGPHEVTIVETHSPDAPFIFESLKNYFQKEGLRVFSAVHPLFTVRRQWERVIWLGEPHDDGALELYCQFRIERVEARERQRRIEHQVYSVLKSVSVAVEDFPQMVVLTRTVASRLRSRTGRGTAGSEVAREFLEWLLADNYVLLGMLQYVPGTDGVPIADQDSALGVFRDPDLMPVVFPGFLEEQHAHILPAPNDERIIDIDYCNNATAIHHLEPIDDVVVREWAPDGRLTRATLLLGRLAKSAFAGRALDIPLLREKLARLHELSGAVPKSHAYREMRAIFNRMPKRELFYANTEELKAIIEPMIDMSGDDEIAVSTRQGARYQAVAVAFSILRSSHRVEEELTSALSTAFGPISFHTLADCGARALLLFYFNAATLEHEIDDERIDEITRRVITTWSDRVASELEEAFGPLEGRRLFIRYVKDETRSGIYRESTPPAEVPGDVGVFEQLESRIEVAVRSEGPGAAMLKIYSPRSLELTETLRTLQNLGLTVHDEMSLPLSLPEGRRCVLMRLRVDAAPPVIDAMVKSTELLRDAMRALQEERATDCPLNALVLLERLTWREVEVLRTLRNHLLQIRPHYNVDTINTVLLRNSRVSWTLFQVFAARFDPDLEATRREAMDTAEVRLRQALTSVGGLLDDEILRAIENLVDVSLRTNFYQRPERPVMSIKIDSRRVEAMASPRPLVEIYVHSRLLEGTHLRGGRLARGGIRWSDRHDDFRTEILGLMKTQMVKNAIIVPVGSKGGFVMKGTLPPRPALDGHLVDRYREFISGMLDITDNLVDGRVLHPPAVVHHDGPDPYLVVAADKGTAHLSDTANQVSAQYGFWLGDAFASGGSNGYDHKKEAITARGAWECVKHHFRTLGTDVMTQPFTVCAIGDMAGDVFGNGMLMSRATRLIAAFNHVHVFLDPNPDPERSYTERERLFRLPRSTWRDYDPALISPGGGVFDRTAKAIPLSPEVRQRLGIDRDAASGEEVIKHILMADVDLLYNGGIGTYIKASSEEDADVGDRGNDRVRVNADMVKARVIAEGGNLGLTQKARMEYWAHSGRLNTDAIDNSAGVDMSDHEVNIKIFLDVLLKKGVITNRAERNRLLREMTNDVSTLVLTDNAGQALALTLDSLRSARQYEQFVAVIDEMVATGVLKRSDEAIPRRDELLTSPTRDRGLPRPLLAVLLGYAKNWARMRALDTTLPDTPVAQPFLAAYFPALLRERYREHVQDHPLKREIIATAVVNYVINRAGVTFIPRLIATTGGTLDAVVAAYLEADRATGAPELRARVQDRGLAAEAEFRLLLGIEDPLEQVVRDTIAGREPAMQGTLREVAAQLAG